MGPFRWVFRSFERVNSKPSAEKIKEPNSMEGISTVTGDSLTNPRKIDPEKLDVIRDENIFVICLHI